MEMRTDADLVVVLHAVLPRDAGDAVGGREVVEGLVRPDELGELVFAVGGLLRPDRVAPAEVVQSRETVERGPHGDRVPDGFVDGGRRHVVGVDVAVAGADAVGDDDALKGIEERPDDGGVARAVVDDAGQGLDHASPLDLVVVLADDRFLAADVQPREHRLQGLSQVRRFGERRVPHAGGCPGGPEGHLREAVMEKIHIHVNDGLFPVADMEPSRIGVTAQDRRLARPSSGPGREMASIVSGATASVIRSWDSEMRISQGFSPGYLRGAFFRSISQPPESRAVSPTEEERPPAPLSVMAR